MANNFNMDKCIDKVQIQGEKYGTAICTGTCFGCLYVNLQYIIYAVYNVCNVILGLKSFNARQNNANLSFKLQEHLENTDLSQGQ